MTLTNPPTEKRIVGIDPGLRFTGIAQLLYDTQSKEVKIEKCDLLKNPPKYKGLEGIVHMMELLLGAKSHFSEGEKYIIESPTAIFHAAFASGSLMSVCHVSGAAAIIFGLDKIRLTRPNEWNYGKKKEKTHLLTQDILGSYLNWPCLKKIKAEVQYEHILDAASMALWYARKGSA
jgi:hypothetical protein